MTEHLLPAQIEAYHRQRLAPAEFLEADDHLAACEQCRRLVAAALNNSAVNLYAGLAAEATAGPHLSFEQSAAYVDGLMTGEQRRVTEDHLASCAECGPAVDDLRAFRNEIAADLDREYRPRETAVKPTPSPGWRDRIALPAPLLRLPWWGYAVPALLVLALAGWMSWRVTSRQRPSQIARETPTPAPRATSPLLVRLNDGGSSLTLDAEGRLAGAEQWPPAYQQMAREALSNQRVDRSPLLASLNQTGSSLMGSDDEGRRFAVIEPAGKVLLSDRPAFRWSRLEGATGYLVEVYDAQFNPVASSPLTTDTSWTSPPLARGQLYAWQVRAVRDGQEFIAPRPPAPQARFRVLGQDMAAEIARARRDYPSSHLLLGLLYARAGMSAEAEREFRALQKANSDSPDAEVVRKLLSSVSARR